MILLILNTYESVNRKLELCMSFADLFLKKPDAFLMSH